MKIRLQKSEIKRGYRGKFPNHGVRIVICTLIMIVFCVLVKLFIIGEPVDGAQVNVAVSAEGQTLSLRVDAVESAVALGGWQLRRDGNTLSISARKVLVSPLFPSGTYQTEIDLEGLTDIELGGRAIWSDAVRGCQ